MATLTALTDDEKALMARLAGAFNRRQRTDERLSAYYEGQQRLDQIGIAVPPELRRFETVVNWPRVAVDEPEHRLDVKSIILPGQQTASDVLREAWEANNLESQAPLHHKETMVFGRGFVTVGTNEADEDHPIISVEPPRQMVCVVEQRRRRMLGAMRAYIDGDNTRRRTLYLPDATIHLAFGRNGWQVEDRDDHELGRVPVVMFLNRPRLGDWWGTSEMADVIPLTDAAARSLTNLQIAQETHSVPTKFALGVAMSDFIDPATGKPVPAWEAYYTSFMASSNKDATIGQLAGTSLSNFHETVNHYGQLVASVTGLPARYFVNSTVNPAAEGAIRADESRLVKNVERKQNDWGDGWGWVAGLYERFRTGEWIEGNRVRIEWHDAGTPTFAQKADAIQKLSGGVPLISRQGAWDEFGWSEARKDRERDYFKEESSDSYLGLMGAKDEAAGAAADAAPVG